MEIVEVLDLAKEKTGSDGKTAAALGEDRRVISAWRTGANRISYANGIKLCRLAGVPLDALLREKDDKSLKDQCILCEIVETVKNAMFSIFYPTLTPAATA